MNVFSNFDVCDGQVTTMVVDSFDQMFQGNDSITISQYLNFSISEILKSLEDFNLSDPIETRMYFYFYCMQRRKF